MVNSSVIQGVFAKPSISDLEGVFLGVKSSGFQGVFARPNNSVYEGVFVGRTLNSSVFFHISFTLHCRRSFFVFFQFFGKISHISAP